MSCVPKWYGHIPITTVEASASLLALQAFTLSVPVALRPLQAPADSTVCFFHVITSTSCISCATHAGTYPELATSACSVSRIASASLSGIFLDDVCTCKVSCSLTSLNLKEKTGSLSHMSPLPATPDLVAGCVLRLASLASCLLLEQVSSTYPSMSNSSPHACFHPLLAPFMRLHMVALACWTPACVTFHSVARFAVSHQSLRQLAYRLRRWRRCARVFARALCVQRLYPRTCPPLRL